MIEDGCVVIRVPIARLPECIEASWASGILDERWRVEDSAEFAQELVTALNHEEEDGTTPVMQLLDTTLLSIIENGANGLEIHPDQREDV